MLAEQAVRYCVDESGRVGGRDVFEKLLPDIFGDCWSVAWPILSGGMEAHRDRIWAFKSLLSIHDQEGKTVAGPIFLVPWEVLRAWCHKNPGFAPAFLMRIAPRFEEGTPMPTELRTPDASRDMGQHPRVRQWSPVVFRLLDDFGDRKDVLDALTGNMMTFSWWGSLVHYFEQYAAPLRTLLDHHRPSVAASARRQLVAKQQAVRKEQSRDDEQEFGIF